MDKAAIYLQEASHQIRYARLCFAAYRLARQTRDISSIFLHVHHFVVHATNVDKLLNPKSSNRRIQILKDYIDLSGIDLKGIRRLRNHLEHLDERLDDWVLEYDGSPFFDNNLIDGTRGFPERAFLRALDGNIFKFFGENFDLIEILDRLDQIDNRIPEDWRADE